MYGNFRSRISGRRRKLCIQDAPNAVVNYHCGKMYISPPAPAWLFMMAGRVELVNVYSAIPAPKNGIQTSVWCLSNLQSRDVPGCNGKWRGQVGKDLILKKSWIKEVPSCATDPILISIPLSKNNGREIREAFRHYRMAIPVGWSTR